MNRREQLFVSGCFYLKDINTGLSWDAPFIYSFTFVYLLLINGPSLNQTLILCIHACYTLHTPTFYGFYLPSKHVDPSQSHPYAHWERCDETYFNNTDCFIERMVFQRVKFILKTNYSIKSEKILSPFFFQTGAGPLSLCVIDSRLPSLSSNWLWRFLSSLSLPVKFFFFGV